MIPKKLLIGGTAAVGTVGTAAVVTNKYGFPSSTASRTTEPQREDNSREENNPLVQIQSNIRANDGTETTERKEIKLNLEKITKWFDENIGKDKWKVKIKKGDKGEKVEENDQESLLSYLNSSGIKELLKSLSSQDTVTIFTFEYEENSRNWENVPTAQQILSWVKNTSGDKATLKLENENLFELESEDLKKLFRSLDRNEILFTSLKNTPEDKKTILFEEYVENVEDDWHHSKTKIEEWENENNFKIKIKKGDENSKTLDETDEGDLVGLLSHLDTEKKLQQLPDYWNSSESNNVSLTLKKEQDVWKLIYEDTINDLINNTSNNKAKLELYGDGSITKLSSIKNDTELKQLFEALAMEEDLFKKENLNGYTKASPKTIIFEKVEDGWKHIKEAIGDFAKDKYTLKIKINGGTPKEIEEEDVKDEELIGLLKHIQDNEDKEGYEKSNENKELILEKNKSGGWQLFTTPKP